MTTDLYTKTVLTVIATALSVIALRTGFIDSARAVGDDCGRYTRPCYVEVSNDLDVNVQNWPSDFDVDVQNWPSSVNVDVQNWP